MNFTDQPNRNREIAEAPKAVIHGSNVVDDFVHVLGPILRQDFRFCSQDILQGALGPLNLARQNRFLADVHVNKQIWIRQRLDGSIKTTECPVRLGEQYS